MLAPAIPWKVLLQRACSLVLKHHRRGEPATRLSKDSQVAALTYAINPLVFKRKITIVYGDGGLGKSTWALFCAMIVSTGGTVAGISAGKGCALYLDWEDDADVHTRRLHAIQAGHPELADADVLYQRCTEPLTKMVYQLVRRIVGERITFVVLDSLMASTGGDSSAEGTAKLFAALRLLDCEVLALGHVPKTQPESQERTTVYGSVFNQNFARSVWELKKEQEVGDDTAILGLFQRKSNLSRLHQPIGLKVTHNETNTLVRYEPYDLSQAAELAPALPLASRIRNLLEDGVPRTSKEISEELEAKQSSIKAVLSKHKGRKWCMIGDNKDALWTILHR
jgi:RecA-family ATPase